MTIAIETKTLSYLLYPKHPDLSKMRITPLLYDFLEESIAITWDFLIVISAS
jgi:hypothetical protein